MKKECNFAFLYKIDKNLFFIANDAERLYCDEYFEQCMVQTRRFAETVCRNITNSEFGGQETFDEILAVLKDKLGSTTGGKEFINDLYFLKKAGNQSVHSSRIENDGIKALECLQRAFETAINFAMIKNPANRAVLSLQYDEELLITGKRSKEKTLRQKYTEQKQARNTTAKTVHAAPISVKPKVKHVSKPKKYLSKSGSRRSQSKKINIGYMIINIFLPFAGILLLAVLWILSL